MRKSEYKEVLRWYGICEEYETRKMTVIQNRVQLKYNINDRIVIINDKEREP